ncbi:MAG: hypothetical protein RL344_1241 [Pseudomonadota bacterium]|jgi:predicted O-methyltransferase YrrM
MIISLDTDLNCKLNYKNTFLNNWYLLQKQALSERIPVISIKNAYFLRTVLQQYSPKYMLEIGSAIGVSSAWIGNILYDWGGQLDTIDISLINYQHTKINLNHLNIHNVQAYHSDALLWLEQRKTQKASQFYQYDCIFIDAHKLQSHFFYTVCLLHLKPNSLIIIDDAWKFRHKMTALYKLMATYNQSYSLHFVDNEDATLIVKPNF